MRISVCGTGYVGLVLATCLAESGHEVTACDIDESKIRTLNEGGVPIYEPGLKELIARNTKDERLRFTTRHDESVPGSLVHFVCVETPPMEDGRPNLKPLLSACKDVGRAMTDYGIVVLKSTVPVGTADRVRTILKETCVHQFDVVSNPEFLKEGAAVDDFMRPDRVVIGTSDVRCAAIMRELYAPFVRTGRPILVMDNRSAEMTKYAANSLLASRISFINEIANACEALGADIHSVREGMATDRRIGYEFLFPGCGYGGSCFPKDVKALVHFSQQGGYEMRVLQAVEEVNQRQKMVLARKVIAQYGEDLSGHTFAVWGLSFKPRTDDMREAPSIVIIEELLARGAKVRAHDPEAMDEARHLFGDRIELGDNYEVLDGATALIVVTEWNEFRNPDFQRVAQLLKEKVIFDGRNIYDPRKLSALGFTYRGVGIAADPVGQELEQPQPEKVNQA